MELREIRTRVDSIQDQLPVAPFVELVRFDDGERVLRVALTDRFRQRAMRAKVWASEGMLRALTKAQRGFRAEHPRSLGGDDGIFVLDRNFRPENVMMRRMFQGFLDQRPQELRSILSALGRAPEDAHGDVQAVRLVADHTRLLGLLVRGMNEDWLILVDLDPTKLAA